MSTSGTGGADRPMPGFPYFGNVLRPFGHADAIAAMSTVAAPLLAGFAITASALILQIYERLRFADLALFLLAVAAVLLIMCVQFGFWARHWWWGSITSAAEAFPDSDWAPRRRDVAEEVLGRHVHPYAAWSTRARTSYTTGIVFLLAGLAVLVGFGVEKIEIRPVGVRWPTLLVYALAGVFEVCWFFSAQLTQSSRSTVVRDGRTYRSRWVRSRVLHGVWRIAWAICPADPIDQPVRQDKNPDPLPADGPPD